MGVDCAKRTLYSHRIETQRKRNVARWSAHTVEAVIVSYSNYINGISEALPLKGLWSTTQSGSCDAATACRA